MDSAISLLLGIMAWGLTAASFAILLVWLDIPLHSALAIYPLTMLAGAASMLPGGLGSTEATMVGLLAYMGSPLRFGDGRGHRDTLDYFVVVDSARGMCNGCLGDQSKRA